MTAHSPWRQIMQQWLRAVFSRFVRKSAERDHMEIERKFSQTGEEAAQMAMRLQELGFRYTGTVHMSDTFLPAAVRGEMLRVRQERLDSTPSKILLTFKQWVPTTTGKERKETECEVPSITALAWLLIGRFIAGHPLLGFGKRRQLYEGSLNGSPAVVSVDDVSGLGRYSGWYMEIEVIQPVGGDYTDIELHINELARKLFGGAREPIMRSYMDMLIESTQS